MKYKFIIMHQDAKPTNKKLEKDIGIFLKKYGYKFVGSGYDFTNKRRDIEYEKKRDK